MPLLETASADLRHRVLIEAPSRADDGLGGATRSWTAVATVWAKIDPLAGSETSQGDQLRPGRSHIIRIRYRSDATPSWRLTWAAPEGTRVFNVRSVIDVMGRHQWIDLHCREGE